MGIKPQRHNDRTCLTVEDSGYTSDEFWTGNGTVDFQISHASDRRSLDSLEVLFVHMILTFGSSGKSSLNANVDDTEYYPGSTIHP